MLQNIAAKVTYKTVLLIKVLQSISKKKKKPTQNDTRGATFLPIGFDVPKNNNLNVTIEILFKVIFFMSIYFAVVTGLFLC